MRFRERILTRLMTKYEMPRIKRAIELERTTSTMPGAIRPSTASPARFDISLEMMNLITSRDDLSMTIAIPLGRTQSLLSNKRYASESLVQNPTGPATEMTENFRRELEAFARLLGIGSIGYTTVPRELVFRDVSPLHKCNRAHNGDGQKQD
ncbi:MAG: hypothetical protein ACP6IT_11220 [Candidatus Thorarchaeota archaeon]